MEQRYYEFYDSTKTYYSPIGQVFTPEVIQREYPIVTSGAKVVVETDADHIIFGGFGLLSQYKTRFNIDSTLSDDDALTAIITAANTIPTVSTEPTPEERIAAALEFQNVLALPTV